MQPFKKGLFSLALLSIAATAWTGSYAADQSLLRFHGTCDGSAAIAFDDGHLLVGYDETNQWYRFASAGGHYVESIDYGRQLGLTDTQEVDVEAVARSGDHIWWLGSHGRASDGAVAASRRILFKTTRHAPFVVAGESIDLLQSLQGLFPAKALSRKPDKGGVNFEGLAGTDHGALMIGVRAPLSKTGQAMVIEWQPKTQSSAVHWLDLGNRGVRALARFEAGYLLIAGGAVSRGKTALYHWTPGGTLIDLPILDSRVRAEAIVTTANGVLILSDDGKVKRGDKRAKKGKRNCDKIRRKHPLGERHTNVYFRAQSISLVAIHDALENALQ
jgi:hypothetical protein